MKRNEMKIEETYSDRTMFLNGEKFRRVIVSECNQSVGRRRMYTVRVVNVDPETGDAKDGETVATRCTYDQAMRIAEEHYFK